MQIFTDEFFKFAVIIAVFVIILILYCIYEKIIGILNCFCWPCLWFFKLKLQKKNKKDQNEKTRLVTKV